MTQLITDKVMKAKMKEFDEIGFGNQTIIPGGKYGAKRVELKDFIRQLLKADRKAIRKEIKGMKKYHEGASKRDNQIYDKTIDDVLDLDILMKKEIKKLKIVRMSVWGEEDKELKFKVVQKKINEIIEVINQEVINQLEKEAK